MNIHELIQGLADRVSAGASVRQIFGEPVVAGDRTVIPAAQFRYGFGAGGGATSPGEGGGGGGGVIARPFGALEISPEGTRFIPFGPDRKKLGAALLLGVILGATLAALARRNCS